VLVVVKAEDEFVAEEQEKVKEKVVDVFVDEELEYQQKEKEKDVVAFVTEEQE
jgi:hypothetical protein